MVEELHEAFPPQMIKKHKDAVDAHRLENEILATKVANRLVNRLGPSTALDMTEEEGAALGQVAAAFLVAERLLDLRTLWDDLDKAKIDEKARIQLFAITANTVSAATDCVAMNGSSATERCGTTKNSSDRAGNANVPISAIGTRSVSRTAYLVCTPTRARVDIRRPPSGARG